MAIKKKSSSNTNEDKVASFIEAAAVPLSTETTKAKTVKKPVALRFDEHLLIQIDAAAAGRGISRNAWISWQCAEGLKNE
jgi:predicted HicB family RNase H-like nuclease